MRVAERRAIAFHGTGALDIESFEPRQPIDFAPFGDQKAVFATSDPVWAMFYAIVDRDRYEITLNNGCILVLDSNGRPGTPHYYFSISRGALEERPWRDGYVYFLPADTFVEQPAGEYGGHSARVPQLASPVAGHPVRTSSRRARRLSFSGAHSRARRRTARGVRPGCDDRRRMAGLIARHTYVVLTEGLG